MAGIDIIAEMRPASYRGAGFYIDNDSIQGGRRLKVHEHVDRDDPVIEDLGGSAQVITVKAFVSSANAKAESEALFAAGTAGGPATLRLHGRDPVQAHCKSVSTDFDRQKLGYYGVNLQFQIIQSGTSGLAPVGLLQSVIGETAYAARDAIASGFRRSYQKIDKPGTASIPEQALNDFVGLMLDYQDTAVLGDANAATPQATSASLIKAANRKRSTNLIAEDLDRIQENILAAPSWSDSEEVARDGTGAIERVYDSFLDIVDVTKDPVIGAQKSSDIFDAMVHETPEFLEYTQDEIQLIVDSGDLVRASIIERRRTYIAFNEDAAAKIMSATLQATALAGYCVALAKIEPETRAEAIRYRAQISAMLNEVSQNVDDADMLTDLTRAVNEATKYLSRYITDLRPVVSIETQVSLPVIYMTYQLYGNLDRAEEIVARNGVEHPLFLPPDFEAISQ